MAWGEPQPVPTHVVFKHEWSIFFDASVFIGQKNMRVGALEGEGAGPDHEFVRSWPCARCSLARGPQPRSCMNTHLKLHTICRKPTMHGDAAYSRLIT